MTDSQIPQDLENQLAGPGGQFPGTAETLATPVGSDQPVRVKIGQQRNRHLQLTKEEYRARSARQREIDAQVDPNADPAQDPQLSRAEPPAQPAVRPGLPGKPTQGQLIGNTNDPTSTAPLPRKPGRPKGRKGKPIGQPCPAPSTTAAPTPPIPVPTDAMLDQRMSRLERGMDMIVRAIAERDERQTQPPVQEQVASEALAELDEELQDDLDELDPDVDDEPTPGASCDEPPPCVATQVADNPELDKGLQALQQMILKRNPQKVFRQYWCQLSRAAQYNEWPPERREAFDEVFNSMVAHPKFVHQMSTFLRGSRSGNCIGNEQIARVCGMVAGFLTVYQLAAAGR